MRHTDTSDPQIRPEDRRLIETIAQDYRPEPMDATRQAVFRRRLEERLAGRARFPWRAALAVAATAAAAVLWFTLPHGGQPDVSRNASAERAEAPLLFAFVDPDGDDPERLQPKEFLPDDYAVLANVLDVPLDDL